VKAYEKSRFFVWFASGYRNPEMCTLLDDFGQVKFDNLIMRAEAMEVILQVIWSIVLVIGIIILGIVALIIAFFIFIYLGVKSQIEVARFI